MSTYCNKVVQDNLYERKGFNEKMRSFRGKTIKEALYKQLKAYSILNNVKLEHIFANLKDSTAERHDVHANQKIHEQETNENVSDTEQNNGFDEESKNRIPTFQEFIWYVLSLFLSCGGKRKCLSEVDAHIRPQVILCSPCPKNFDLIIKVTN